MASIPYTEELDSYTFRESPRFVGARPGGGLVCTYDDIDGVHVRSSGWNFVAAIATWEGAAGEARRVAVGPSGEVATGYEDGMVKVWLVAAGKAGDPAVAKAGVKEMATRTATPRSVCVLVCTGHGSAVESLTVSPLDGTIVSGSWDKTAKVWNGSTGDCVATLEGHTHTVDAVCVLENGDIVTGSRDRTVRVWTHGSWTCTAVHRFPSSVSALGATPLGGFAVGGGRQPGFVSVWRGGEQLWRLEMTNTVRCLAIVSEDFIIAATAEQYRVLVEGSIAFEQESFFPLPVVLSNGNLALFRLRECTVYRVLRPARLAAIRIMAAAWEAHAGVPVTDQGCRATTLARLLSLRRVCRLRGETEVGRPTELVEPFGQAVIAFL